jgi:hypothetical protein
MVHQRLSHLGHDCPGVFSPVRKRAIQIESIAHCAGDLVAADRSIGKLGEEARERVHEFVADLSELRRG